MIKLTPILPAIAIYLFVVGLFYLSTATVLIVWKLLLAPIIIYLIDKNIRNTIIAQGLFYEQVKVMITY